MQKIATFKIVQDGHSLFYIGLMNLKADPAKGIGVKG